jgi:DNA-binding phage protein
VLTGRELLDSELEKQRFLVEVGQEFLDLADRRASALLEARQSLDRVADLIGPARSAGLSMIEIARFTGVSRQGLYDLWREARER